MMTNELIDSATVEEIATISRRTIDRREKKNEFPKRVRIGYRTVRWVRQEVEEWKRKQIQARPSGDHNSDHASHSDVTTRQEEHQ